MFLPESPTSILNITIKGEVPCGLNGRVLHSQRLPWNGPFSEVSLLPLETALRKRFGDGLSGHYGGCSGEALLVPLMELRV